MPNLQMEQGHSKSSVPMQEVQNSQPFTKGDEKNKNEEANFTKKVDQQQLFSYMIIQKDTM